MRKIFVSIMLILFATLIVACKDKEFTVSFDTTGGSNVASVVVKDGETATQPTAPTRDGYIFDGWFKDEAGNEKFDFSSNITSDVKLYAKWRELAPDEYVVTFETSGGSNIDPVAVVDGQKVTKPSNPTRHGYVFADWTLDGDKYNFDTPITKNITLVAVWDIEQKSDTYYTYISDTTNLNPYSETLANASDLYGLISDALFRGDYDWDLAIEEGIATKVGDFTNTELLPFNYFPAMAAELPIDVNGDGVVWRIVLKDGLKFVDGTKIDANTFNYSYQQLLDPKLLNARATNLYETDSLPLVNAKAYFEQTEESPVAWSTVGFKVIDDLTMEFTLTSKKSQWQVMTQLASAITSVVHPVKYEEGKIEGGTRTTYGTIDNPLVAFGVYELIEWEPGAFFIFKRNEAHYDADAYRIRFLRYEVIADQSIAVTEFSRGNLDLAGIAGEYFPTYENSPYLKLSPATTFFRFAFSLDREGSPEIMKDPNFRLALYFATDRETFVTDVRKPGYPTQSILGPVYYSSEQNPFAYRASEQGQDVMADLSPETYGFDPVKAKALFEEAYAKSVADGHIKAGDIVDIEFVFYDAESNHTMANWLESTWEDIFGDNFDLVKTPVDSDTLDAIWDTGNFDLTFGGWQGMAFWAPGMLQVYSSGLGAAYILETGFETGNVELEIELAAGKVAVQGWLDELLAKEEPTELDEEYIEYFEEFLEGFEEDVFTATYDELWSHIYYVVLDYDNYEGRDYDFDSITATLEKSLLDQMINIPLFTTVGATVYSSRVVFEAQAFHPRMGWGGLRYMYLDNSK